MVRDASLSPSRHCPQSGCSCLTEKADMVGQFGLERARPLQIPKTPLILSALIVTHFQSPWIQAFFGKREPSRPILGMPSILRTLTVDLFPNERPRNLWLLEICHQWIYR